MSLDIYPEFQREEKPRLIVPALIWLGVIAASIVIALMLTGCAQTTFQGTCALKPMGQDENGHVYVVAYCEAR